MSNELRETIAEHYCIYRYINDASRTVWACTSLNCGFWHAQFSGAVDHMAERIAPPAAVTEALEQEVAELLYVTRDYTWQIQARRVIELLKGESCTK